MASMFEKLPSLLNFSNPGTPVSGLNAAPGGGSTGFQYQDPMQGMGFVQRMEYLRQNNPEVLGSLAQGLLKGDLGAGIGGATKAMGDLRHEEMAKQQANVTKNQTKQWLIDQGYTEAEANAAMENPEILRALIERKSYELQQKAQKEYDTANGGASTYGNPIDMIDPDTGDYAVAFQSKNGQGLTDRYGKPIDPRFREMSPYERSGQTAFGKQEGDDAATVESEVAAMESELPRTKAMMAKLEKYAGTASFTYFDQLWDATARQFKNTTEGARARTNFENLLNLSVLPQLRITFGSQFTAEEGQRMQKTVGDPNASPIEKRDAIKNFIAYAEWALKAKKKSAAGHRKPIGTGGGGGSGGVPTYNPETGDFE